MGTGGAGVSMGAAVKTAVQSAVTDTIGMFGELLPIALTVFAATWGVKKAMTFFRKMA